MIKKLFFLAFLTFLFGCVFGFSFSKNFPSESQTILKRAFENLSFLLSLPPFLQVFFLFFFNLSRAVLIFLSGFLFFLFPFFASFVNGFLLGIILESFSQPAWKIILSLFPHGIFELPALFFSVALGAKAGIEILKKIFRKKIPLLLELKKSFLLFLKFVLPLLFVAAVFEILVSKPLTEFLLK